MDKLKDLAKITPEVIKRIQDNPEKLQTIRTSLRKNVVELIKQELMDFHTYENLICLLDFHINGTPIYTNVFETINGQEIRKVYK